jgi:hypothetical protein
LTASTRQEPTLSEYKDLPWQDMKYKGYVHIKRFLTDVELQVLREDWLGRAAATEANPNENYPIVPVPAGIVWRFHRKIKAVTDAVNAAAGINADSDAGGIYFATTKGINFGWHQDHESYFIYQQHHDYLNFYIPVIKPDAKLTNICVIPMDQLQARIPAFFANFVGSGAKTLFPGGGETRVYDDTAGLEYTLPINIEELKVTPEMEAGDLLLVRGDVLHRTQDTDTGRVAVSFRRTRSVAVIRKESLESGCIRKQEMIKNNPEIYRTVFDCFDEMGLGEITAQQLHSYFMKKAMESVLKNRNA